MKASSAAGKNPTALDGLRILDLCDETGWLCGGLLAGLGAEVILVQPPGKPVARTAANLGKRHLGLDLSSERGREIFLQIAEGTDVVIESFPPGRLEKLGLGFAALQVRNPGLILASITPFGGSGPYRDFKTSELVASALGGQMSVSGEAHRRPLKPYGPTALGTASLFAANAVLLALRQRRQTGKGAHLDISIHEAVAGTLDHLLPRYFATGEVAGRSGSLYWNNAFRVFKCRDGHILLTLFYQWPTLLELLKAESGAGKLEGVEWEDENYRREHIQTVIEVLEGWTASHKVAELVELGQAMRFPWAAVASLKDVLENPQLNFRAYFVAVPGRGRGGKRKIPGPPFKLAGTIAARSWPGAGEYNRKIYLEELGLSTGQMSELKRQGVI